MFKKKAEKRKSEQRADVTNEKQWTRFCVKTNHINNHIKCKWSKCGDCQIRFKKQDWTIDCLQKKSTLSIDTNRLEVKGWKNISC